MSDVTSATATFLFTDIEGSTQLLKAHRGEYASILEDHHRILREAFSTYGGREVDNQGDSFFVAFPRARAAVLAAATAQRGIAEHSWPGGATVRVRMGIHTGEADLAADRYVGMSVHRAARISSVGHGGQVLVSPTTAGHLEDEDDLPGVALRDLGEHRLKDISRPVRLHQLDIEGLPGDFPPLRSEPREPNRRRRAALAGGAAMALAATAIAAVWLSRDAPPPEIVPNSVVRIDPQTLEPTQVVPVGNSPDFIVATGGYVWITHFTVTASEDLRNAGDRTLTRVDPSTGEAVTVGGLAPCAMTADPSGDLWVINCSTDGARVRSNVVRVAAETLRFEATWPIESFGPETNYRAMTFGGGALWVTRPDDPGDGIPGDLIERIDPVTGARKRFPQPGGDAAFLAWSEGYGDLWTTSGGPGDVWRMNAETGEAERVDALDASSTTPEIEGGTVWLNDLSAARLVRLNAVGPPDPHPIPLPVKNRPASVFTVAAGAGAVWATTSGDNAIWRIDPKTNDATRIPVPYAPISVAADDESVWVTVLA